MCKLIYKDQVFILVVFHNDKGYDFNQLYGELLNKNAGRRQIKALPCGNGKTRALKVGILKFIDSFCFMVKSLSKTAEMYKTRDELLYPYEYFENENFENLL